MPPRWCVRWAWTSLPDSSTARSSYPTTATRPAPRLSPRRSRCAHAFSTTSSSAQGGGNQAGGHSGLGPRHPRLPAAVAGRTVVFEIDQPQVIEFKSGVLAVSAPIPPPIAGRWRSIFATTGRRRCATADLIRAHRLDRRGTADLPAARRPGPLVRQHHRAERAGQPAGDRAHGHQAATGGPRSSVSGRRMGSTSTSPSCSIWATATPPAST